MSLTQEQGAAPAARHIRNLIRASGAALSGRTRGHDREVRRSSFDVEDDRAKPWSRVGDGSVAQGLAHRDALLQTAEELYHQGWTDLPAREARAARDRRATLAAELQQYVDVGAGPVGRPAALRQEIERLDALLDRVRDRLRRTDLPVLKALIRHIDFATGRLFPCLDTIASAAGCHRNSVVNALRRLQAHGVISWVRRSVKTANEGEFAPQREQTSNAYYFEHRQRMAPRVWQRFCQLLAAKIRRIGRVPAPLRPAPPTSPPVVADPGLRAALDRVGALIPNAIT